MSTWFAFNGYHTINVAGVQEKTLVLWGFHGYATEAQANAHPNSVNILNKAIVDGIEADYGYAKSSGEQPGGPNATLTPGHVVKGAGQAAVSALGLPTFSNLRDFVVRTVKVLLGMALIIAGINSLMKSEGIAVPKLPPVVPV